MSETRELNMAKIAANIQEEDNQQQDSETRLDSEQSEQTQTQAKELSTQRQINRLEKALEIAKSSQVKEKLREEIKLAKIRKEEEEKRKKEELDTIQTAKTGINVAGNVVGGIAGATDNIAEKTRELADSATSTLATVSTPGSIFLPIALLLLFFFLILPINGMTRAQWLWMALTGQAKIGPEKVAPRKEGGSGDINIPNALPVTTGYRISNNTYSNRYIRRTT